MTEKDNNGEYRIIAVKESDDRCPPHRGWRMIVIFGAVTLMNICCVVPLSAFGLLYGPFLASVGDETSGSALSFGFFSTLSTLTSFLADILLKRFTNRSVALTGALFFFIGSVGLIFMRNGFHMILFFGVFEGIGFGLILPSVLTALVSYFSNKEASFLLSVNHTTIALFNMFSPYAITFLLDHLEFRNTLIVAAGCSVILFPAMATLRPMKEQSKSTTEKVSVVSHENGVQTEENQQVLLNPDEDTVKSERKGKLVDFSLLKSLHFLNLIIGTSFAFASEGSFNSLLRVILNDINFADKDVALMMTIYYGADLITRICFSVVAAFIHIKSWNVLIIGTFFTGVFRIVFILRNEFVYRTAILVILGIFKCLMEIPMVTVLVDEYKDKYSNALAFQMIFNGIASLILGPLITLIKQLTGRNLMVIHFLTSVHLVCSISWIIELIYKKMRRSEQSIVNC